MENIDLTTSAGWATAAGTVLVAVYGALRRIKGDVRVDKVDDAAQKLIDNLMKQHASDTAALTQLAQERNEAIERVGSLDATVKHQTSELSRMSTEVRRLETEIDALRTENRQLQVQNTEVLSQSRKMETQLSRLEGMVKMLVAKLEQHGGAPDYVLGAS